MLRRLCTSRVLHSSKISGGRWPGCWLTNAVASHRFRPRRVTFRSISSVACIVCTFSRLMNEWASSITTSVGGASARSTL